MLGVHHYIVKFFYWGGGVFAIEMVRGKMVCSSRASATVYVLHLNPPHTALDAALPTANVHHMLYYHHFHNTTYVIPPAVLAIAHARVSGVSDPPTILAIAAAAPVVPAVPAAQY